MVVSLPAARVVLSVTPASALGLPRAIFILTFGCEFPALQTCAALSGTSCQYRGIGVLFLAVAALCYNILAKVGLYLLVPEYASVSRHVSLNDAGKLVRFLDVRHVGYQLILRFRSATHSDRTGGYGGGIDVSIYYRHAGAYAGLF